MPNQRMQAIGVWGNDEREDILKHRKAAGFKNKAQPYCAKHRSHFCPCVRPEMYSKPGELAKAKKDWDEAEAKYQAKKEAS